MRLTLLLSILIVAQMLFSLTNVPSGNVSGTYTLSGSPYMINGDITIQNGQTLTINPGVQIIFSGLYKLKVDGRIVAIGTAVDSIKFTTTGTSTKWKGIRFYNTSATNDTSFFNYCILENGDASGNALSIDNSGGALCTTAFSKLHIEHCRFSNNSASVSGGACFFDQTDLIIKNCIFSYNSASSSGGGLTSTSSNVPYTVNKIRIYNSAFNHNYGGWGGGAYIQSSTESIVQNCTIDANSSYNGGGIMIKDSQDCFIRNCTITKCISNNRGGGINGTASTITISDNSISGCYFTDNWDNPSGMGIALEAGGPYIVNRNKIFNNLADPSFAAQGGGIRCLNCIYEIVNNAIFNNGASVGGGLMLNNYGALSVNCKLWNNTIVNNASAGAGAMSVMGYVDVRNNIIWGNTCNDGYQIRITNDGTNLIFAYNDIQNGLATFSVPSSPNWNSTTQYVNNISATPQFIGATSGSGTGYEGSGANWQIPVTSPCRNSGDPAINMGTYTTDLLGNTRIDEDRIDIGTYEYQNPLNAPRSMQITRSGSNVIIRWDPVTIATGYALYSSTNPYSGFTLLDNTPSHFTLVSGKIQWTGAISTSRKFFEAKAVQ